MIMLTTNKYTTTIHNICLIPGTVSFVLFFVHLFFVLCSSPQQPAPLKSYPSHPFSEQQREWLWPDMRFHCAIKKQPLLLFNSTAKCPHLPGPARGDKAALPGGWLAV